MTSVLQLKHPQIDNCDPWTWMPTCIFTFGWHSNNYNNNFNYQVQLQVCTVQNRKFNFSLALALWSAGRDARVLISVSVNSITITDPELRQVAKRPRKPGFHTTFTTASDRTNTQLKYEALQATFKKMLRKNFS